VKTDGRARLLLLHTPHHGVFCAGADLRERRTMSQTQVSDFLDSLRGLISELESVNVPSLGVVDGYALGGGMEIALGCDLRVGGTFWFSSLFMFSRSPGGTMYEEQKRAGKGGRR
jgi:methylglutaconyl-CoA hydratase